MRVDEFIAFLRGTRARPPPGSKRPRVTYALVAASFLHLPIVYLLVAAIGEMPSITLGLGLLSIGLAWGGGVALEGRRSGTVRALSALGVMEGALAFVPAIADPLGNVRWLFLAIAALCGGALIMARSPDVSRSR